MVTVTTLQQLLLLQQSQENNQVFDLIYIASLEILLIVKVAIQESSANASI